jgi:hypothetical protein
VRITERPFPRAAQTAGALLLYLAFAIFLTWPLVLHLGSSAYMVTASPHGGDVSGTVAQLRELAEHHQNPFLPGRLHDFAAPEGMPIRWALNVETFSSMSLLYVLALLFGAVTAFALFTLSGFVASGTAMFLFTRRLTGSAWIALIFGWAFAFYPFALATGEHPNFIHGWVFVLVAWRLLRLIEEPTARNGLWLGAATVLAMSWTQHFILIGGVWFAALVVGAFLVGVARGQGARYVRAELPAVGLVAAFVLLMRQLLFSSGGDATLPQNVLADIVNTSAHLPMYLVPPAHSIYGGLTTSYLDAHHWNAVEWTLYVGIAVLCLAVLGVAAALLRRLPAKESAFALVVGAATLVAFVFSLPPKVELGGKTVYLPSELVFRTSSSWRLYTRFVIVVMLGLCILAALGLAWLSDRSDPRLRAAILAAATILVPLDLWDRPPDHIFRFSTDLTYHVLRAQPPGDVAEYPLRKAGFVGDYLDLYNQDAHGKPILNGYLPGPNERRALSISRLDDSRTASSLATLGVRYVLVTPWRVDSNTPDPGRPGRGFRLLARDGYGSLYRVVARPAPFVFERDGFWGPEGPPKAQFQWAGEAPVRLGIVAPCDDCSGILRFTAASFARPRRVGLVTSDGRRLSSLPVGLNARPLIFPLHFRHRTVVELVIEPGPQSIAETLHTSDPRRVSIYIKHPAFVETP